MTIILASIVGVGLFYGGMVFAAKNGYTVAQLMNPFRQIESALNKLFKK